VDDAALLESVLSDTARSATIFDAAPEAAVAHCPGWSVTDLVGHHGEVLRWAEAIVRTGEPVDEQFSAPARHDERHTWYLDAAHEFVATVSGTDRDRPCWTFGRPPDRVWFWIRRQALEAAVHRWDAELAAGSVGEVHSDLSVLGVTEVVEDLFPRQVALGRTPALSCGVELRADDVDQRWTLSLPTDAGGVVVEAPASVLMLLLWQRASLDDPRVRFTGPTSVRDELSGALFAP
jgi:uncharacterized protein (TIGR03083 family)